MHHLDKLEAESINIIREVASVFSRPVMLYSIGKDSGVMLHLALKAFYPIAPPFPFLHIDTNWKFREMIDFRTYMQKKYRLNLLVYKNPRGIAEQIDPFRSGSEKHTYIMKTEALRQALDINGFDAAIGGARRDEEKSRAKERIYSHRSSGHRWDPKLQRPEPWGICNEKLNSGESMRIFPLSNWTEKDIWQYIFREKIEIVPLYYSAPRAVVMRGGQLIMVNDERMPLEATEVPVIKNVRFRTLGCYPLTAAVESEADTIEKIVDEVIHAHSSERIGRVIDFDSATSMEAKKQEGYF